jgi:hypothetical protein
VPVPPGRRGLYRRRGGRRGRACWHLQGGVAGQDRLLQAAQLRAWLQAELVPQRAPCGPVVGERLGLPAGPVAGEHQLRLQPFPYRVGGAQLAQQPVVRTASELGLDPVLHGDQPQLL